VTGNVAKCYTLTALHYEIALFYNTH